MKRISKNFRRLGSFFIAGLILFSLTACGSSSDGDTRKEKPNITSVGIEQENKYPELTYNLEREIYGLTESTFNGYTTKYYGHEYNSLGQLIKVIAKTYKDKKETIFTYLYDDQSNIIYIKEDYILKGTGYLETYITYNEFGYKDTEVFISDVSEKNGDVYTYTYKYDELNRAIEMKCTSANTDYVRTEKYSYADSGRINRTDVTEPDNSYIIADYCYASSDHNYCTGSKTYNSETKKLMTWNSYAYDDVSSYFVSSDAFPQLTTTNKWRYFEEAPFLPTPDSVVSTIEFDSAYQLGKNMIYRFIQVEDNDAAREDRYLYTEIIKEICKCDIYDEVNIVLIGASEHSAITQTQAAIYWHRLDTEGYEDGRVYLDFCFPTKEMDEYDLFGIERPSYNSSSSSSSGSSSGSYGSSSSSKCDYCNGTGKKVVTWYSEGDWGEKTYSSYTCTYCNGTGR